MNRILQAELNTFDAIFRYLFDSYAIYNLERSDIR